MKDILTSEEAAELLGCAPFTIEQLARKREVPAVKFGTGWVFPRQALIEHANLLARHHVQTPQPSKPALRPVEYEKVPWWEQTGGRKPETNEPPTR